MNYKNVTLAEILDAREERSRKRDKMINLHMSTLIQLTINSPGSEKNSAVISEIFSEAFKAILGEFKNHIIEYSSDALNNTGPVALFSINSPAPGVKQRTCSLESSHPLGRLWDMDVYDWEKRLLSRKEFSLPERLCFICGEPAHLCARSQRHKQEDLKNHILGIFRSFSNQYRIV